MAAKGFMCLKLSPGWIEKEAENPSHHRITVYPTYADRLLLNLNRRFSLKPSHVLLIRVARTQNCQFIKWFADKL